MSCGLGQQPRLRAGGFEFSEAWRQRGQALLRLRNRLPRRELLAQSLQSIMGATLTRRSKSFIVGWFSRSASVADDCRIGTADC